MSQTPTPKEIAATMGIVIERGRSGDFWVEIWRSEIEAAITEAERRGESRAAADAIQRARANWAAIGGLPEEWREGVEGYCDRIEKEAEQRGWLAGMNEAAKMSPWQTEQRIRERIVKVRGE